jgi:PAS domain S-box-containing protein
MEEAITILQQLAAEGAAADVLKEPDAGPGAESVGLRSAPMEPGETLLRVAEARYRALVEQIPAVTFVASLQGGTNEIYVSPQIEALLGFTQAEWTNNPVLWFRQLHAEDREKLSTQFAQACLDGRPFRGVVRVLSRHGRTVWVHGEARFVRDTSGLPLFLQGVAFDITEQKQGEELRQQLVLEQIARQEMDRERGRLLEMFTSLPAAVCVLSGTHHVIDFMNPVALETYGVGLEVLGKPWRDAFPHFSAEADGIFDRVLETGVLHTANESVASSPRWDRARYFNFVCQPLRDSSGGVTGVLKHAVEVTEQVLARQRVEDALQARDDFISIAAHELRNPIHALLLSLQALSMATRNEPERFSLDWIMARIARFSSQVDRLMRLTESLLDVARINAGRLQLDIEEVDLLEVVTAVLDRLSAVAQAQSTTVSSTGPVIGRWDRLRLEQIVSNLYGNALKYGGGRPIEVSVEQCGEVAVLAVRDHGGGISVEDQVRVFEKFERAASVRKHGGLGLGLWITRQIVEALGGQIRVESTLGTGSRFVVELPL